MSNTKRDPLDTAYLTIGAYQALKKLDDKAYDNLTCADGEVGVIQDLLTACGDALHEAWAALDGGNEWGGGCWAYDICEWLGMWWVETYAATNLPPLRAAVAARLAEMIATENNR